MSTCRSCNAAVIFVPSAKTGKPMILDAKPAKGVVIVGRLGLDDALAVSPDRLDFDAGVGVVKTTADPAERRYKLKARVVDVFTDHHVTCPAAADWKGRTRADEERKPLVAPAVANMACARSDCGHRGDRHMPGPDGRAYCLELCPCGEFVAQPAEEGSTP